MLDIYIKFFNSEKVAINLRQTNVFIIMMSGFAGARFNISTSAGEELSFKTED